MRLLQTIRDYNFNSPDSMLDFFSLSLAGMRDGVGPLLTLYLASDLELEPVKLAQVVAAASFATLLFQMPVGRVFDQSKRKSLWVAFGACLMIGACIGLSRSRGYEWLIGFQLLMGISACFLSIGFPAVCKSLTTNERLPQRFARNELFAKIGNFSALAATGFLAQALGLHWVFYVIPFLAIPVIVSCLRLSTVPPLPNVDDQPPSPEPNKESLGPTRELLFSAPLILLVALVGAFEFANASMFFVFEQALVKADAPQRAALVSAALVLTQIMITSGFIGLAWFSSVRPFKILNFGLVLIVARGLILSLSVSLGVATKIGLLGFFIGQILDGWIAAILFTQPMRLLAEMKGRQFGLRCGLVGTFVSSGAAVSTLAAGHWISLMDEQNTLIGFTVVAVVALLIGHFVSREIEISEPAFLPERIAAPGV